MENTFHGTGVALITPFDEAKRVDSSALTNLVEYQIENGTDYLVVLGTTGEAVTLTKEEKKTVVDTVLKANEKRVPIVLGLGGNNTAEVCKAIEETDFSGVNAILCVVPFYNKPSQEGIFQHYMAIEAVCPVPIILYNVPSRTGVSMSADTTVRLAEASTKFVAVKEASGCMTTCAKIVLDAPNDFAVISGDDGLTVPMISIGAKGVISVAANACPKTMSLMTRSALKGDFFEAQKNYMKLVNIITLLFAEGSPSGIKAALSNIGICQNELRLPLVPASDELYDQIEELLQTTDVV